MKKSLVKITKKYYFVIFFSIYENGKQIWLKTQRKTAKESAWKIPKSFWRRKKETAKKGSRQLLKSSWRTNAETTWVFGK